MATREYWIEGPWKGRLAIAPRPRGGEWLEAEVSDWREVGVDVVVSLLTPDEVHELDLGREEELCEAAGIRLLSFPILDRGVPSSHVETASLVIDLEQYLTQGKTVALHCRQGIGRSSLIAACLLVVAGEGPDTAFIRIGRSRGLSVPDTDEQEQWVAEFASEIVHHYPTVTEVRGQVP